MTIQKIKRLKNEKFRLIPNTSNYYISNMGRAIVVKENEDGVLEEILLGQYRTKNKTGKYYNDIVVVFNDSSTPRRIRVNRCVAAVWKDPTFKIFYSEDKRVADHINNNSEDNRAVNIRVYSQSENIKSAIYELNLDVGKPTRKCFARKGSDYREYQSTCLLVRDISKSKNPGVFNHAVKYNHKLYGYTVGYLD